MKIDVDKRPIEYKITGEGERTVVILQGWGTSLKVYDYVASCISSKCRVISFDFPGFGDSPEPEESWSVDEYTDFFVRFMEVLDIKKATLIGHSYGGRVIIKLANRQSLPFEITDIVLIDSAGVRAKRTPEQEAKVKRYKKMKKIADNKIVSTVFGSAIENWKKNQGSEDYRNATPIMRGALVKAINEDLTHLFEGVKCETLLIWGESDTATPLSDGKLMEELMPRAGLAVVSGSGHYPFLEQPVVFRRIMESYFRIGD